MSFIRVHSELSENIKTDSGESGGNSPYVSRKKNGSRKTEKKKQNRKVAKEREGGQMRRLGYI